MFEFEWNRACEYDWPKIRRLFVAAYVGAYKHCDIADLDLNPQVIAEAVAHKKDPLTAYFEHAFDAEHAAIAKQTNHDRYRINYLIVRYCDQPVAFIVSQINFKSGRVYVRWNTVAPSFQNQGIGKLMLAELARHYGSHGLELYTRTLNAGACNFYKKNGLKETSRFTFDEPKYAAQLATYVRGWLADKESGTMYAPEDEKVDIFAPYTGFFRERRLKKLRM